MTSKTSLMSPERVDALIATYRDGLLHDTLPFWINHGVDREYGGFLFCLDRDGTVIDTDKSVVDPGPLHLAAVHALQHGRATPRVAGRWPGTASTSSGATLSTATAGCSSSSRATAGRCASAATSSRDFRRHRACRLCRGHGRPDGGATGACDLRAASPATDHARPAAAEGQPRDAAHEGPGHAR